MKKYPQEKIVKSFKIKSYHALMLRQFPWVKAPGILICILLDAFFAGELPQIKDRFEKQVANSKSNLIKSKLKKNLRII